MSDPDANSPEDTLPGEEREITLSEGAEAVKGTLRGCYAELDRLQHQLRGTLPEDGDRPAEAGPQPTEEGRARPRARALYVASRLEACAGALRKASRSGKG